MRRLGIFTQYQQAEKFVEGSMIYNNTEFYIQDNWKVNNRLTLDYGMRFTRQQPQHDQFQQMSNFFPDQWIVGSGPVLYIAGLQQRRGHLLGQHREREGPATGQVILPPAGAANTQVLIGTPIPGSGNALNGIRQAGDGISDYGYTWPTLVFGPRFGAAYDSPGTQSLIIRGGVGLFYDRPDGNTVFSIPGNPPIASSADLRNGALTSLSGGLSPGAVPQLVTFQYDAKVPASWQWQAGVQMALPWASSLDVSYVGNHGVQPPGRPPGRRRRQPQRGRHRRRVPAAEPGPDASGASTVPARTPTRRTCCARTAGWPTSTRTRRSSATRTTRSRRRSSAGSRTVSRSASTTRSAWSLDGQHGPQQRFQHAADGTISLRADQAQYEELYKDLNLQRHVVKANAVWDLPDIRRARAPASRRSATSSTTGSCRGSSPATPATGTTSGYSYQNNGGNVNMTGSPDYGARIVYVGDPGSGCSDDQYRAVQRQRGHGAELWQCRSRVGSQLHDRVPEQDRWTSPSRARSAWAAAASSSSVLTRSTRSTPSSINGRNTSINWQPDQPDDPQLADARRMARSIRPG